MYSLDYISWPSSCWGRDPVTMKLPLYLRKFAVVTAGVLASLPLASATTILDYSSTFSGTNAGYHGSGQSILVPLADTTLDFVRFYADADAAGQNFSVYVTNQLNNGTVLFSSLNIPIVTGANTFNINQSFTGGALIYVQVGYNGYTGKSLQFQGDIYPGGNSIFSQYVFDLNSAQDFQSFDHRFLAQFSGGVAAPDGGNIFAMCGLVIAGMIGLRRRRTRA